MAKTKDESALNKDDKKTKKVHSVWDERKHLYRVKNEDGTFTELKEKVWDEKKKGKKQPLDRQLVIKVLLRLMKPNYDRTNLTAEAMREWEAKGIPGTGKRGHYVDGRLPKPDDWSPFVVCFNPRKAVPGSSGQPYLRTINNRRPNDLYYTFIRKQLFNAGYGHSYKSQIDAILKEIQNHLEEHHQEKWRLTKWSNEVPPSKRAPKELTIDDLVIQMDRIAAFKSRKSNT